MLRDDSGLYHGKERDSDKMRVKRIFPLILEVLPSI